MKDGAEMNCNPFNLIKNEAKIWTLFRTTRIKYDSFNFLPSHHWTLCENWSTLIILIFQRLVLIFEKAIKILLSNLPLENA